jgi:GntR family transcriptional repressor for pyruvate dehydrogenase complex
VTDIIVKSATSDQVTQKVVDHIRANELGDGDRLPSVQQLGERFGVAPATLREALRRLEGIGLVEFRHGAGVFLRGDGQRMVVVNTYAEDLDDRRLLDLLDARRLIEPHLAELAARRCTEADAAELVALLDHARKALAVDTELNRVNLEFHEAIARLSGNEVLSQLMQSLLEINAGQQLALLVVHHDERKNDLREHTEIMEAITSNDAELAAELARSHMDRLIIRLRTQLTPGELGGSDAN